MLLRGRPSQTSVKRGPKNKSDVGVPVHTQHPPGDKSNETHTAIPIPETNAPQHDGKVDGGRTTADAVRLGTGASETGDSKPPPLKLRRTSRREFIEWVEQRNDELKELDKRLAFSEEVIEPTDKKEQTAEITLDSIRPSNWTAEEDMIWLKLQFPHVFMAFYNYKRDHGRRLNGSDHPRPHRVAPSTGLGQPPEPGGSAQ